MSNHLFICKCIVDTHEGLREGLSLFSGPSRTAAVFAIAPDAPVLLYDPENLLRGHEPKFKELYLDSDKWRTDVHMNPNKRHFAHMFPEKNLQLAGLISFGARSSSVAYQMWFTEHHPDMCCTGPTERWLEHAAWRFSHDIANEAELYTGISGTFLREYAMHAVRDYIVDEMNVKLGMDTHIRVYPILDAVLGISRTREENAWPRGEIVFSETWMLDRTEFLAKFPETEQPALDNLKHVRKLLSAVENSVCKLASNGRTITGIISENLPVFSLVADFRGHHGFLRLNDTAICSFSDGRFRSTTHRAKLVELEEALLESGRVRDNGGDLFRTVADIVHEAESCKYGCTIVVDLNDPPVPISGQKLVHPLDLHQPKLLDLAKSLAKVDGALHIGIDLQLHGFGCLLDGRAFPGEDRARGARYNSALRFTAEHDHILVVVVSVDRPVSLIQQGIEVNAQCQWHPECTCHTWPLTLERWIAEAAIA